MFKRFGGNRYKVDYGGSKQCFMNAKDEYRAGEKVTLFYDLIATDTDYHFSVSGAEYSVRYGNNGYEISFVMPDNDVSVRVESHNSMVYVPPQPEKQEEKMLMNYYSATVAAFAPGDSYELALYEINGGEDLRLVVYQSVGGSPEKKTGYRVPQQAAEEAYALIKQYGLADWNARQGVALCGHITVVKWRGADGSYTRASTENMPEDGRAALESVGRALGAYCRDENKIEDC